MHSRKVLLAVAILLVGIVVVISLLVVDNMDNNMDIIFDELAITHKIGQGVKMDISGMHFSGLTILAVVRSMVDIFVVLFLMFLAWRVLLVLEKLSDTCDRLLQQKISEGRDRETE